MIPGVGFFYSGLLRRKNALSMIYLSMMTVAMVSFQVCSILQLPMSVMYTQCAFAIIVVLLGVLTSVQRDCWSLHWRLE
jgi:ammonia channel protein AmtB